MTAVQLKNAILQYAIQGKLVPQNPNDEPASVLLEKIRKEKRALIKTGKIKKDMPVKPITAEEIPFEIPENWEWVRLGELCIYIQRGKSPKYSPIKKYPVIAQKCNQWTGLDIEKAQFIDPDTLSTYDEERLLQTNDLLWNSTGLGTLGRMVLYNIKTNPYELAVADSHVTVIRPLQKFILSDYLYYYFLNPTVQFVIEDMADGSTKQKELATNTIINYLLPLPPLDEQKRIVKRIEELLPLINDYDKAEQALTTLNNEFSEKFKKSVLQAAIQGKLVPQDLNDEPASILLERIHAERKRLIRDGKIKPNKEESVIFRRDNSHYEKRGKTERCIDDEIPFDLPENWVWARLGAISVNIHYGYTTSAQSEGNSRLLRITDIQNNEVQWDNVPFCFITTKEFDVYGLKNRDVMIARTGGTIGKSYIVRNLTEKVVFASYLIRIIPLKNVNEEYIKVFLETPFYWVQLKNYSMGTGQPNVNGQSLRLLAIPLPPLAEQKRIVSKVEKLLTITQKL